jgi:NADH dehydrogenase [ubiquinone] 1 alpha subcomplex assembly factor 6
MGAPRYGRRGRIGQCEAAAREEGPMRDSSLHSPIARRVRAGDPDRFLVTLFAPAEARPALLALAAFDLELDRIARVTTQPMAGLIRLQWWRESLDGILAGEPRTHPVVQALAHAAQARPLPRVLLESMIDAREPEQDEAPPADLATLEALLDAREGSHGVLCLHALGAWSEAAEHSAREVGQAFGLVRILRATGPLARLRRMRLPADLVVQADLDPEALFSGRPGRAIALIGRTLAARAEARLTAARARRSSIDRAALPALLPAVLAEGHLRALRRAGHDPLALPDQRPATAPLRLLLARLLGRF